MDNQFNFDGSPMPPKPEKKKGDGFATASLVLGIVALVLSCPIIIAAMTSSSDMPDISDEQALIDWTYRWLEKTMGKEFADEWYQNMMNAINGNNMDPLDTGALES